MHADLLKELSRHVPESVTAKRTHINALFYGDWGVGKTTLACSSGKATLLVSSGDGGESVLRNKNNGNSENISLVQCQGLSHIKAILNAITEQLEGYKHYQVVVVDTISSICDQYLNSLVANYNVAKDRATAKPKTSG